MTTLGDYLKKQGFKVDDSNVPYGREATWEKVKWLFVHHTAGSEASGSESGQASYIRTASGRYPPLAQLMLGQSSKVWVCSKQRSGQAEPGRASHAGEGSYPGIPKDSANQMSLGVEVHCSGAHALSTHKDQYKTLISLLASLCKRYGLNETKVIGHKEYSSTGKIDPKDSMNTIRKDVKAALAGGSSGGGDNGAEDGEMKHTIAVTDLDQPLVLAAGAYGYVDFRDVDEDDEDFYGDLSIIPTRYIDFDTSGWLEVSGPCRVRVCRYSEDGVTWEGTYTIFDWPQAGFLAFEGMGGCKAKKRLRVRVDATAGPVTVTDGRWITRYRDHIA